MRLRPNRRGAESLHAGLKAVPFALFLLVVSAFLNSAAVLAVAEPPALPAPTLACPIIEAEEANEEAPPPGDGKTLPGLRVNSLAIDADILDGDPLFFPANMDKPQGDDQVYAALEGPPAAEALSFEELMALSTERIGVTADGASQLVLRLHASVPGTFKIALMPEGDASGEVTLLRDGETCATGGDEHVAFAVYYAPADFGKRTGEGAVEERVGRAEARDVNVIISFTAADGEGHAHEAEIVKIVRPPVVLVHGLFDNALDAWLTPYDVLPAEGWGEWMRAKLDFLSPSGDFGTMPGVLDAAGFETFLVDFSASNGRGGEPSSFDDNRYVVWTDGTGGFLGAGHATYKNNETGEVAKAGGIRDALAYYRDELNVAAARADVIGHSMGGVLARVYAADRLPEDAAAKDCKFKTPYNPNYRRPDNFYRGDINRLITLNTPHNGSGQTALFELLTRDEIEKEGVLAATARSASKYYSIIAESVKAESPAMQDLRLESCALRRIGETQVPSHLVVAATRAGGQKDPIQDPDEDYYTTLKFVSIILYYFPEVLDKFVAGISPDWQDTEWEGKFPAEIRATLQDLIDLEADYWVQLRDTVAGEEWWRPGSEPEREEWVPYVTMEALRALMFRFDDNDSTVRVDSQRGGLDLDSDYVTYAAASTGPGVDIQQSMLHRFSPRERAVQVDVVNVLRSGFGKFAPQLPPAGAHMPGKAPPPDFAVDWQITGDEAIAWSGLVFSHANALEDFAADYKVVIMTRPVNPDATALIGQFGAATKGMNIKGKSSNWGPQRGYLPANQRYSKLWRNFAGTERDDKIKKYGDQTAALLEAKKPEYLSDAGKPLAVDRQLMHCWPGPCPAAGESTAGTEIYTVWEDPDEKDAEAAVYFCKGQPANGDTEQVPDGDREKLDAARKAAERPCDCTAWLDWRNGDANKKDLTKSGEFDIKVPPDKAKEPPSCGRLRPLRVLADNTLEHQPFLTADYDLLAIGFYCPEGSQSANPACRGRVTRNADSPEIKCTPPTEKVNAYHANYLPPDPLPCLDPQKGLITEGQKSLLDALNAKIAAETGYESGNVSHHGPETNFYASPYVDYPITVFDPAGPDGKPAVVSIPKGPKGFRDIHLKRYYERKIREGFWLYPNTAKTANWKWIPRGTDADWRGWEYEDDPLLATGEDVEEMTPPPCVQAAIERRKALIRGADPPPIPPELICAPEPGAAAEAPEPQIEDEGEKTGAKKPGSDEHGALAPAESRKAA